MIRLFGITLAIDTLLMVFSACKNDKMPTADDAALLQGIFECNMVHIQNLTIDAGPVALSIPLPVHKKEDLNMVEIFKEKFATKIFNNKAL